MLCNQLDQVRAKHIPRDDIVLVTFISEVIFNLTSGSGMATLVEGGKQSTTFKRLGKSEADRGGT
jgi:hypothetical protein